MPSPPSRPAPDAAPPNAAAPRLPVVTRRRLHRGHFALLRAVAQGVAPRSAVARFVPEAGDPDGAEDAGADSTAPDPQRIRVHRLTGWVRAELCAAAARGGNYGRATLLRLDLAPLTTALPSLAAFAAAQGLEDFSESEQLAAYEATFGTALAQQRRRTALLRRQLLAIHQLEATMAAPVSRLDGCEAWLTDAIAARLAAHGLHTLADLHARVVRDAQWWRAVPGVGAGKAAAIRQFLLAHAGTLGPLPDLNAAGPAQGEPHSIAHTTTNATAQTTPAGVARPDSAPRLPSPFVPLASLVLPDGLDGSAGRFRAPADLCLIGAANDREAILAWLAVKAPSPVPARSGESPRRSATYLAYEREAERLLLWCLLERRRALSSLTAEDAAAYVTFLQAPPLSWCGPRNVPRWAVGWRPIEGPLAPRSVAYALSVLGNLFAFLMAQHYLVGNPWRAVRAPARTRRGPDPGRGLSQELWQHVADALDALPPGLASQRLGVALHLLYEAGLRLAELVAARTGDLEYVTLHRADGSAVAGWWLHTLGKGRKARLVPVSAGWIERLGRYLVARGVSADPRRAGGVPVLGVVRGTVAPQAGVSGSALHGQLKRFLAHCASQLATTDPALAERLRQASAHWLRHTHVTHALAAGVPLEVVQQNVGHASLATTSLYVRTEDARRLDAMRKLWRP
ncbi:phage integrase family protein [Cupriavidus metallidurans]|uniref:phage integrase family protein n=1 Tax=Cupriavidus metallidurans TaxID=119219 RepID=UPI001CCDC136|nr:phage integrase family protein [Cupriavidus metallidurans]UBM09391.1 site-specific integrase [Cupriavidus metallidurans]